MHHIPWRIDEKQPPCLNRGMGVIVLEPYPWLLDQWQFPIELSERIVDPVSCGALDRAELFRTGYIIGAEGIV